MKESLENYKRLVSINPESYEDRSGLFEILESVYIQLCNVDPYFNAFTEYSYLNVVHEHRIIFFKQVDLEKVEIVSEILLYCYYDRGYVELCRIDKREDKYTSIEHVAFGRNTFMDIYTYLKEWFNEILINVNKKIIKYVS